MSRGKLFQIVGAANLQLINKTSFAPLTEIDTHFASPHNLHLLRRTPARSIPRTVIQLANEPSIIIFFSAAASVVRIPITSFGSNRSVSRGEEEEADIGLLYVDHVMQTVCARRGGERVRGRADGEISPLIET